MPCQYFSYDKSIRTASSLLFAVFYSVLFLLLPHLCTQGTFEVFPVPVLIVEKKTIFSFRWLEGHQKLHFTFSSTDTSAWPYEYSAMVSLFHCTSPRTDFLLFLIYAERNTQYVPIKCFKKCPKHTIRCNTISIDSFFQCRANPGYKAQRTITTARNEMLSVLGGDVR